MRENTDFLLRAAESRAAAEPSLQAHWEQFYWTSARAAEAHRRLASTDSLGNSGGDTSISRQARYAAVNAYRCSYDGVSVEHGHNHISFTSPYGGGGDASLDCMLFLASWLALRPEVSSVAANRGARFTSANAPPLSNFSSAGNPTDQNAYLQSGDSFSSPYSRLGLDGDGCVLGLIDSGLDDLSCFLVDSTGEHTTRTPKVSSD